MLAVTRERLVDHLQRASALVDTYARRDPDYPRRVLAWMTELEETLGQLRSPLASMVAAERGLITAVDDGLRPPEVLRERISPRKAIRATASLSLAHVEGSLRSEVASIDHKLDEMRERMAQLMAIATNSHPIPLPVRDPRQAWLDGVWAGLAGNGETRSLYTYLNAALTAADRSYLLNEILMNLISAQGPTLSSIGLFTESEATRLGKAGIDTPDELLAVASTTRGRRVIEEATGRDRVAIQGWVRRLGLMKLRGVTAQDADLLVWCGVASIADLRRRNATALVKKMRAVNADRRPGASVPSVETVEGWMQHPD